MQKLIKWLPDFSCVVTNLQNIDSDQLWQAGLHAGILVYTMANFWSATDDVVAKIIEKSRGLNHEKRGYLLDSLIDYYENTDKKYGRQEFDRIERQRWPELPEEELLMPEILLGRERAHKEGIDKGIILGRKEGVDLGRKEGVDLGRKEGVALGRKEGVDLGRKEGVALGRKEGVDLGRKEGVALGQEKLILKMLKSGKMTDDVICDVFGFSRAELAGFKRKVES